MGGTPWAGMAERRPCWGAVDAVGKSGIAPLKKHPASELLLEGTFKSSIVPKRKGQRQQKLKT